MPPESDPQKPEQAAPKGPKPEKTEAEGQKPEKAEAKAQKPEKGEGKPPKGEPKPGKSKAPAEGGAEKPKPAPRPPADPRLKLVKKFHGKFLPRGPLRDRHKALMARWNSGADHGGVTVDELKALLNDWKASKTAPASSSRA